MQHVLDTEASGIEEKVRQPARSLADHSLAMIGTLLQRGDQLEHFQGHESAVLFVSWRAPQNFQSCGVKVRFFWVLMNR